MPVERAAPSAETLLAGYPGWHLIGYRVLRQEKQRCYFGFIAPFEAHVARISSVARP